MGMHDTRTVQTLITGSEKNKGLRHIHVTPIMKPWIRTSMKLNLNSTSAIDVACVSAAWIDFWGVYESTFPLLLLGIGFQCDPCVIFYIKKRVQNLSDILSTSVSCCQTDFNLSVTLHTKRTSSLKANWCKVLISKVSGLNLDYSSPTDTYGVWVRCESKNGH